MQNSPRMKAVAVGPWGGLFGRWVNGLGALICAAGLLFAYYA